MNIITRTVTLCGPTAAVGVLERLSEADRQLVSADLESYVPVEAIEMGHRELVRRLRKSVNLLVENASADRIFLLGLHLDVLEAFAREEYRGCVQVLLPANFPDLYLPTARRNVPEGLNAQVCDPGLMPTFLNKGDCVVTLGFYAGADLVLVDRHVEPTLGFVQGRRFHGDTCVIMPNPDEPFDARPNAWNTIRLAAFRSCYTPSDGRRLEVTI